MGAFLIFNPDFANSDEVKPAHSRVCSAFFKNPRNQRILEKAKDCSTEQFEDPPGKVSTRTGLTFMGNCSNKRVLVTKERCYRSRCKYFRAYALKRVCTAVNDVIVDDIGAEKVSRRRILGW